MQVSEHLHALRIPFTITTEMGAVERFVYAFIVFGPQLCLIDTGVASSEGLIFDYIRNAGRSPEEISSIILTHSHPDHLGAAQRIKHYTHCQVMAHGGELDWIQDIDKQYKERPVPGFYSLVDGSVAVDRILEEGDEISLGDNLKLKVLHTPGHSEGSISLYLDADKVLIAGDVVPVPGDMPIYDDPMVLIKSIQKLMSLTETAVFLSSWDLPRSGSSIATVMAEGIEYVNRLHTAVLAAAKADPALSAGDLCRRILAALNLPPLMANPLVTRSLASSLRYLNSRALTSPQGETMRLLIKDSTMAECAALQELNEASDYMADWVGEKFKPDYIHTCLTEGYLPPGGSKEFYQPKSIYAKGDGRLIGFSEVYHGYPGPETFYIGWLFIHPEFQHQGYGQEFVNYILGEAAKLGFTEARLGVHLKNWPGLRFWSQMGFDKLLGIVGDSEHSAKTFAVARLSKSLA